MCLTLEMFSHLHFIDVFNLGNGFVLLLQRGRGGVHLFVRLLDMVDFVVFPLLVAGDFAVRFQ